MTKTELLHFGLCLQKHFLSASASLSQMEDLRCFAILFLAPCSNLLIDFVPQPYFTVI